MKDSRKYARTNYGQELLVRERANVDLGTSLHNAIGKKRGRDFLGKQRKDNSIQIVDFQGKKRKFKHRGPIRKKKIGR